MQPIRIDRCPHCNGILRERSIEQNSKLHALLSDISRQKQWAGKWLDIEAWKRLLVAAWERAEGRSAEFYPAIDGAGFDIIYSRTSRMSKQDLSSLLEYVIAWAIEQGVVLQDESESIKRTA